VFGICVGQSYKKITAYAIGGTPSLAVPKFRVCLLQYSFSKNELNFLQSHIFKQMEKEATVTTAFFSLCHSPLKTVIWFPRKQPPQTLHINLSFGASPEL